MFHIESKLCLVYTQCRVVCMCHMFHIVSKQKIMWVI